MTTGRYCSIVLASVLLALPVPTPVAAQGRTKIQWKNYKPTPVLVTPPAITDSTPSFYKRKGEWQKIIDEYWGPGAPLAEKRRTFNRYADYIQRYFTAFEGLGISWDSLRSHYYSQINDSTSHGRFSAILSYLAYALREPHVTVLDYSMMSGLGLDTVTTNEPCWGKPVWIKTMMPNARHFGAVLTPQADSSAVVVRAMQDHPLGLRPGDVVLGYEGVPWRNIARELLAAEVPSIALSGGSRSRETHQLLACAGFNWHLFDTIDIVKYGSADTLHLSVDTLASIVMTDTIYNHEVLEVPGVPMPDWDWVGLRPNRAPVTHGTVEGTNIGYIYVVAHTDKDGGEPEPDSKDRFSLAISDLWNTDGLIIDLRHDNGGWVTANFNASFAKLLNFDTHTMDYYWRQGPGSLTALAPYPYYPAAGVMTINADEETVYDRPIAVLVGPRCVSMGDITAYRLTYFPNVRFFGKPTAMGMGGYNWTGLQPQVAGYELMASDMMMRDHYDPGRDLERLEFPVDEEVWLTREDIVNGDDTVVKRALAWIQRVAHARAVTASGRSFHSGADTMVMTTEVRNPDNHPISVVAFVRLDTTIVDSITFADDGLHGDGTCGDGIWGGRWALPAGEQFYSARLEVNDPADPSTFSMPYAARFTTAGPIIPDSFPARWHGSDLIVMEKTALVNMGEEAAVPHVTGTLRKMEGDTVIDRTYLATVAYGDILPDSFVTAVQWYSMKVLPTATTADTVRFSLKLDIASNGFTYWRDTLQFALPNPAMSSGVVASLDVPAEFRLFQNFPNPFNPSTVIGYQLPVPSDVTLTVYDLLGREVAVLVKDRKAAGSYTVPFHGSGLSSGLYVYQLRAGGYVQTRNMLIIK